MVRDIEQACARRGFTVAVCNTDENLARERTYVELMLEEKAAGVIMAPATEVAKNIEPLLDAGIPGVTVDRLVEDDRVSSVLLDNSLAGELLVEHLLEHGHRNFAAVMGTTTATPSRERLASMARRIQAVPGTALTVVGRELREAIGVERTLSSVGPDVVRMLRSIEPMPTAIVCANAIMLISVMCELERVGLAVPDDIAVVGFDDMPGFPLFRTPITVISQSARQIGNRAVEILFESLSTPHHEQVIERVEPEFIIRSSCGRHDEDMHFTRLH